MQRFARNPPRILKQSSIQLLPDWLSWNITHSNPPCARRPQALLRIPNDLSAPALKRGLSSTVAPRRRINPYADLITALLRHHPFHFNSFAHCAPPRIGAAYFALAYVSENQVSSHVESAGKRQTISPDFPKLSEGSQKDSGRQA